MSRQQPANPFMQFNSGNPLNEVFQFINSLSQLDDANETKPKRSSVNRERDSRRNAPTSCTRDPYPRVPRDGFTTSTNPAQARCGFGFTSAGREKSSAPVSFSDKVNANPSKSAPVFNIFRKPDSDTSVPPRPKFTGFGSPAQPNYPPPEYPRNAPVVDKNTEESMALITKLMAETGIKDTATLIQKLKILVRNEEHTALMAKCPETRTYVTKYGDCIPYLDVEDVLQVIIPGARLCNSDIAQLNIQILDILPPSDDDREGLTVVRNNTQVQVYDFTRDDFPAMYDYLTKWAAKSADHILIA